MIPQSETAFFPEKVYIEETSLDKPLTRQILKNLGKICHEVIPQSQLRSLSEDLRKRRDPIGEGKKYLLLTSQKGRFIKPCPCTPGYIGCNYFIINLNLNCPLDCSYCILQHYLSDPWITVHVNLEDLWRELDIFLKKGKMVMRIGTGELGDSFALDHLTENAGDLIGYFRNKKNVLLELKTKTTNISSLFRIKPADNIVISWSLNTPRLAREEECGAPPVGERIDAARAVAEKGFPVGFHFDPLIRYHGCEEDYEKVIRALLGTVPADRIFWISLGSLRFPSPLKKIIQSRFPRTKIIYDELIQGRDGKMRYFRPLRLKLYQGIIQQIRNHGGDNIPLYLCMESADIWKDALGWIPKGKRSVEKRLSLRPL
ncbi:MAG: radical SAM protein [Candidatus Aminicenantales bacterium]